MAASEDTIKGLVQAAERLEQASRNFATPANNNQSTVTLNAGSTSGWVAFWLLSVLCAALAGYNMSLANQVANHENELRNLREYLSAIYQVAPYLKPDKESKK